MNRKGLSRKIPIEKDKKQERKKERKKERKNTDRKQTKLKVPHVTYYVKILPQ